jgi:hypothetical protein
MHEDRERWPSHATGKAGANSAVFQGRLSPSQRLAPGRYVAVISATGNDGQTAGSSQLSFTILR